MAVAGGILELLEYAARPELVPLGCAIPSAELLAAGRLDRFMARAARVKGAHYNVYTEPRGDRDLRREICRRALRFGQLLTPDTVAITYGCTEALSLALQRRDPAGRYGGDRIRRPISACCRCWKRSN